MAAAGQPGGSEWECRMHRGVVAIGAMVCLAATCAPTLADPVEDFYRGRNVTMVIGYSVAGGYDSYARLVSRHIGKYVPGTPGSVVNNMSGAGGHCRFVPESGITALSTQPPRPFAVDKDVLVGAGEPIHCQGFAAPPIRRCLQDRWSGQTAVREQRCFAE